MPAGPTPRRGTGTPASTPAPPRAPRRPPAALPDEARRLEDQPQVHHDGVVDVVDVQVRVALAALVGEPDLREALGLPAGADADRLHLVLALLRAEHLGRRVARELEPLAHVRGREDELLARRPARADGEAAHVDEGRADVDDAARLAIGGERERRLVEGLPVDGGAA